MRQWMPGMTLTGFVLAMLFAGQAAAEDIAVVCAGQSDYHIYLAPDAPSSVKEAAADLRDCVRIATGVELPIDKEKTAPNAPLIVLGDNAVGRAAGLSADGLAMEGFRIVTRDGNLYVFGPDTADSELTPQGGTSQGTRNGVCALLEDELGVRWLLPGDNGADVPMRRDWTIAATDRRETPGFLNRRLPYIQNKRTEVLQWQARMRLGYSLRLNHGHNWRHTVPAELFHDHPDWLAMIGEQRVPPVGRYKLETTNPQLVDYYAARAVEDLQDHPGQYTYSLSPSDSGGWSESPESLRLRDPQPDPRGNQSITPLVLDFYRNVARRVELVSPRFALAGYIYANYLYQPSSGIGTLPDNLYLVVAPNFDYGYTLFRDDVREQFDRVTLAWSEATDRISYYDLPTWIDQKTGAPAGPGLSILAHVFPRLQQRGFKGVYIYGHAAWGHGAISNYVLAKLMWNPQADPRAIADDFCRHAYGEDAGRYMLELYDRIDQALADYYRAHADAQYSMTPALLNDVYVRLLPELERLYNLADSAQATPKQQTRLAMFQKNLLLLHWNLRQRGLISQNTAPSLLRADEPIMAMLSDPDNELALSADAMVGQQAATVESLHVRLAPPVGTEPVVPFLLRGPSRMLLFAQEDALVRIVPRDIEQRGELVRYTLADAIGVTVSSGVLAQDRPVTFAANGGQAYFMDVEARSASYRFDIQNAAWALRMIDDGDHRSIHFLQKTTPLYFHVPAGVNTFDVTLSSAAPGETAACGVTSPAGRVAARMDTSNSPVQQTTIRSDESGWWRIDFTTPAAGLVDDVYLGLDEAVSSWITLNPAAPLLITPRK